MDKFVIFMLNLVSGIFMQQKFKTELMFLIWVQGLLILISFFHLHWQNLEPAPLQNRSRLDQVSFFFSFFFMVIEDLEISENFKFVISRLSLECFVYAQI